MLTWPWPVYCFWVLRLLLFSPILNSQTFESGTGDRAFSTANAVRCTFFGLFPDIAHLLQDDHADGQGAEREKGPGRRVPQELHHQGRGWHDWGEAEGAGLGRCGSSRQCRHPLGRGLSLPIMKLSLREFKIHYHTLIHVKVLWPRIGWRCSPVNIYKIWSILP